MKFKLCGSLLILIFLSFLSCDKNDSSVNSSEIVPTSPQTLVANPGNMLMILSWQAPSNTGSSAITSYNIYKGLTSGGQTFHKTVSGSVLSYIDSNLTNGTTYYYYVTALNNAGESNRSNEAYSIPRPNPTAPTVPTNINIFPSNNKVIILWDKPISNGGEPILGYKIFRGNNSTNLIYLITIDTLNYGAYIDFSVINNNTYYYSLTAFNIIGESNRSSPIGVTPNMKGVISGKILDSLTNTPIKDVTITTFPITSTVMTDTQGNFMISGLAGGNYTLTAKKPYYYTKTYLVSVVNEDTIRPQIKIQFTQILTGTDLIVSEYMNDNSYSAMNIFTPGVIKENQNSEKDIQLRDSLGLSENFYFRSGDLPLKLTGLETKFMGPLKKSNGDSIYTKVEFDNLNKIKLNGTISVSDFYNDRTNTFRASTDANPGLKKVYGLYLKGRGMSLPIYAMIYIKEGYYQNSIFKVKVDVKVNRTGKDLFGQDQK